MRVPMLKRDPKDERRGVFTSGIVSVDQGWKIALYFMGSRHAGENIAEVLKKRHSAANAVLPPEDVGGIPGYEEYLAVLADPEHEEHGNMLQWRGPFHPESFAPDQVNQRLRKKFRSRKMAKSSSLAQK
jgi:hypothetical protein